MLFNSLQFLVFLPVVLLVYYIIPDKMKNIWLLICSYFFYMCWNAVYIVLILFSTVITYLCGVAIGKADSAEGEEAVKARRKKLIVAASLVLNLSILFFFKYFSFAIDSVNALLLHFNFQLNHPSFDVLLPVGISFYTFQALGYTIDVYRGDIYPEKSFLSYALFVSFFPQLVAGPIERSKNLLKQLAVPHRADFDKLREGLLLMIWGFFLKIVLADRIAIFVDAVYGNYADLGGVYIIVATLLFAVQIYCDFGGYSIIAMGAAKLLGVDLMENFNTPYLSMSCGEFWRRWHISLSTWFRDYVYIPLGGNRKGKLRKYINLMITFGVSGLWHGASWTYVIWGLLNGAYQVAGDVIKPLRQRAIELLGLNPDSLGHKLVRVFITFALIDISWVFFRAQSVQAAIYMLRSMVYIKPWALFNGSLYELGLDHANFTLMLICLGILLFADIMKYKGVCIRQIIAKQDYWCQALIIAVSISAVLLFGIWGAQYDAASFIYFQF